MSLVITRLKTDVAAGTENINVKIINELVTETASIMTDIEKKNT